MPRIIIIGAGPCGLGAANRLNELGHNDFMLYEQHDYFGGLAASFCDKEGFTWDFAVHVAHSHYHYIDNLMDELLPDGFFHHERRSWVWEYGAFAPYPFQYNFRHLPSGPRDECLKGLLDNQRAGSTFNVQRSTSSDAVRPKNFEEWILSTFGKGIAKHFMLPYNRKIWSTDPSEMGCQWLGDRVPVVDVERVKRNIEQGVDDVSWGPNATFQFPKKGGTGAIWEALGRRIPEDNVRLGCKIVAVDPVKKEVKLDDGSTDTYDYLISTVPIPRLTEMAGLSALTETADKLRYTHVYVACIAPHFPIPEHLDGKTWIYCPEQEAVFYRVTPFSIFSPAHVPDISQYCSFLCEISRPGTEPLQDAASFIDPTMNDMRTIGLLDCDPENTHTYPMVAEFGYPVPTLNRDTLLNQLIPALEEKSIFSRGRFGGWKYEAANMDHSVMQGVEAVERILQDKEEVTWARPNVVNAGKR